MKLQNVLLIVLSLSILTTTQVASQYLMTRDGSISFYSEAPLENIEAHNNKVTSVLDTKSGKIEFAVLIKAFRFEKALMQEHFNENYMESGKYPKATYKGSIDNLDKVDFEKDGTYEVNTSGKLTIHGVTKEISTPATLIVKDGKVQGETTFSVKVADYEIEIPSVVRDNIANVVDIEVDVNYEEMKKQSK